MEPYLVDVFEVLNYRHVGILADEALLLRLRRFLLLGVPTVPHAVCMGNNVDVKDNRVDVKDLGGYLDPARARQQ